MNPTLQVGVGTELPDAKAIRARLEFIYEEAALLRKLLHITIRIEGRKPLMGRKSADKREVAHVG